MNTRVKICGLTRLEDARATWESGAHAIGLVFHEASPRSVELDAAQEICECAPPFVTRVGVFKDPTASEVRGILEVVPLDLLQFHGEESPEFCAGFQRSYIKAIPMTRCTRLNELMRKFARAQALLLDHPTAGSGSVFDWSLWPAESSLPLILAGGLSPGNVRQALEHTKACPPWAVDVSSGVEIHNSKGYKDVHRIEAFISEVNRAHVSD